jgi:glycosyltransferase involved in cell wall biosynthesis
MKIAILGTRGIPAKYGGFETFAEELATRLVKKGYEVTVYCRNLKIKNRFYKGVRLVNIPALRGKYSETLSYTIIANLRAALLNYDILLICGAGTGSISFISRIFGKKIIININGAEWKRQKFSKLASLIVKLCMFLTNLFAHTIICDSKVILKHWKSKFKKQAVYIPYGALDYIPLDTGILDKYNLKKKKYILYVSRLEPENNAHILIESFKRTNTSYNLVIVGDAPHAKEYISYLKKNKDPRIKFMGYVYGEKYTDLLSNAFLYVHGNEVGGTNPGLLNAMAYKNCVLVINVPYNLEVIGEAGIPFQKYGNDLYIKLNYLLENPQEAKDYGEKAAKRIQQYYTWDKVANDYEKLFANL